MVAQREEEIRNFTPKEYYGLYVIGNGLKFVWQDKTSREVKTFNREKIEKVSENIRNKKIEIKDVKKTQKKSYAPQLYNLTKLQRDANKIFGYSAKETLNIMQRLYENYKLLTYPRTDSRFISTDIIDTLKDRLNACGVGPYSNIAHKLLVKPLKTSKSFVDNSKVSDHHAIIPTEQRVLLGVLSDSERKIYDLVVKRFFSVLFEPFEYEQTNVTARVGEEEFLLQGINVIRLGWKEVYKNNSEYDMEEVLEKQLPILSIGEHLDISSIERTEGETKPPSRFTEGSLLSAMENPSKYVNSNNKELIKTLEETGGIGTVATRADIIEKLFNSFLIELKSKEIFITAKGKQLLDLVPEDLKSPELTAIWEQKLNAISNGSLQKDSFIKDMRDYARRLIGEIKNSESKFKHTNVTGNKCPKCGKNLLEVKNKKGKLLVCQDRECGYKKGVSRVTNARCSNCKKKLELRGEGEGQIFVCSCGFKEKLSSFNERKKEKGDVASKKDISKFLKEQKKSSQEPINTALSDALSKLKFD